mmetsp:Transcript_42315/g.79247  ORF Transcript_42315/g.79247 Transcript_42315/m.79247 type:complete len:306 (-) Transcript_42315:43-960(-)
MTCSLMPRGFGWPLARALLQGGVPKPLPRVLTTHHWSQSQRLSASIPGPWQECSPKLESLLARPNALVRPTSHAPQLPVSGPAFGRSISAPSCSGSESSAARSGLGRPFSLGSVRCITRNLHGRLFYKRRPRMVPKWKFNWRSKWLEGVGCRKGVCTKVMVLAPKKPNSGLRKCAYVRLSNGRVVKTYIPGIGHNLQVHSVVMVHGGRRKDVIGCNYTAMRGHYDLLPVKNRKSSRSKYGVSRPTTEPKRKRFKRLTTSVDRRLHFYRTGEEVGPDEEPESKIKRIVRNNPPVTYQHHKKKGKRK